MENTVTREPGAREKALREMREAKWNERQAQDRRFNRAKEIAGLTSAVAVASQKRGKPRKAKK